MASRANAYACDDLTDAQAAADAIGVSGGLFGGMTLINVNAGTDFTEDAVALDNYVQFGQQIYNPAGSILPDLQQATPPVSQVVNARRGLHVELDAPALADPVSAVLMHSTRV